MSADNGYILRYDEKRNKFILQMYFASADEMPDIDRAEESEIFDFLGEALLRYQELENIWPSEYGLTAPNIAQEMYALLINGHNAHTKENTLDTKQYSRKPFQVDAVQVTEGNLNQVAQWASGSVKHDSDSDRDYVKVNVNKPQNDRQTRAYPGDWVLLFGTSFKVYTNKAFKATFEPVEADPKEQTEELFVTAEKA